MEKSIFLLGPRQTGKSTLLRRELPDARFVDLLEADTFRELATRPERLRETLGAQTTTVVIDEVQKLPELLDEVQLLIDRNPRLRFIMTGSSARKLKRGHANLLGGRAWTASLHPLTSRELGFGTEAVSHLLRWGGLPAIHLSRNPIEELRAYVGSYLREEIQAEGLTRSLSQFSRFLDTASLCSGEQINFTGIGSDAGISPRTVHDHFEILLDTLIGYRLAPFQKTKKRKAVATAKFFLFDLGVANLLNRRLQFEQGTPDFGRVLEHFIFLELVAGLSYRRSDLPLTFWRSQSKLEVDFLIGTDSAIEVKAKERVTDRDLTGLRALNEEKIFKRLLCVSLEKERRTTEDGIEILPYMEFLREWWG